MSGLHTAKEPLTTLQNLKSEIYDLKTWFHREGEKIMGWDEEAERRKRFIGQAFSGVDGMDNPELSVKPDILVAAERFFQSAESVIDARINEAAGKHPHLYNMERQRNSLNARYQQVIEHFTHIPRDLAAQGQQLQVNIVAAMKLATSEVVMTMGEGGCDLHGYTVPPHAPQASRPDNKKHKKSWQFLSPHRKPEISTLDVELQMQRKDFTIKVIYPENLSTRAMEALIEARAELIEELVAKANKKEPQTIDLSALLAKKLHAAGIDGEHAQRVIGAAHPFLKQQQDATNLAIQRMQTGKYTEHGRG